MKAICFNAEDAACHGEAESEDGRTQRKAVIWGNSDSDNLLLGHRVNRQLCDVGASAYSRTARFKIQDSRFKMNPRS